jgi:maltooligosyltrehalose trehalohydrolase
LQVRLGAHYARGTTSFHVWAPTASALDLIVDSPRAGAARGVRPLDRDERGYWSGAFDDLPPGTWYRYRLDRADDHVFPDPASRFQPRGVHGPSEVIDAAAFRWSDQAWRAPALGRMVFYELHVGTFTPAGTFDAVTERLDYLAGLGVTAIELMPVADFAGAHNWGYDGAALFAPARGYGMPDGLRELVDAAHRHHLAVVMDVVYNHFGPDGAYAAAFSPYYFSDRHRSPWGRGLNFDGPHSAEVRRFFIENAIHWVQDYHIDALRLDATHAIVDDGTPHFLAELTSAVRRAAGRDVLIVAEDHRNLARLMAPVEADGDGLDAVWADDFHHQIRVHTTHEREGYYADFTGRIDDIVTTLTEGWFFTGQTSPSTGRPRGTDPSALEPPQFVICIQNHDQIGNRYDGARLHHHIDPAAYRAASALLLLAPQTPLLFMGQEWSATTPFQFFTDHHEELGRLVTAGRRAEFSAFESFGDDGEGVPNPQAHETFMRSRLNWAEAAAPPHAGVLRLYERLLRLRQSHPAMQAGGRAAFDARPLDEHTLALRRSSADGAHVVLAIIRLSGDGPAPVTLDEDMTRVLLSTEDEDVAESPRPIRLDPARRQVEFDRPGAVVFDRP